MTKFYLLSLIIFLAYLILEYFGLVMGLYILLAIQIGTLATAIITSLPVIPGWVFFIKAEKLRDNHKISFLAIFSIIAGLIGTITALFMLIVTIAG